MAAWRSRPRARRRESRCPSGCRSSGGRPVPGLRGRFRRRRAPARMDPGTLRPVPSRTRSSWRRLRLEERRRRRAAARRGRMPPRPWPGRRRPRAVPTTSGRAHSRERCRCRPRLRRKRMRPGPGNRSARRPRGRQSVVILRRARRNVPIPGRRSDPSPRRTMPRWDGSSAACVRLPPPHPQRTPPPRRVRPSPSRRPRSRSPRPARSTAGGHRGAKRPARSTKGRGRGRVLENPRSRPRDPAARTSPRTVPGQNPA